MSLLVAGVLLALLPTRPAHACSCAPPELTGVLEVAGQDQALVVAERTDLDGGPDGVLHILETLAGGPVVGPVEGRFDDGGSCDPWLSSGSVGALVLERRDGVWATTTCGQVGVGEALAAVDEPPTAEPRAGPPTLLLGGAYGGARLAAVDAAGRVGAYAGGEGTTAAISVCPDGGTVLELASSDEITTLHRWSLPDLQPSGEPVVVARAPVWRAGVRCLDPTGDRAVVVLPTDGASGTVATVRGDAVTSTHQPVHAVAQAGGVLAVLLGDGTGAPTTLAVVADDGALATLTTHPGTTFDRLAVSPSGDHVLAAGYPADHTGDRLVLAHTDGSGFTERRLDGFHLVGWLGPDRAWVRDEDARPFGAATTTVEVVDLRLEPVGERQIGTGWEAMPLGGDAVLSYGGQPPTVHRDGAVARVADVRLTETQLAVPIDPAAVLTEADAAAEPVPTGSPTPEPVVDDGGGVRWVGGVPLLVTLAVGGLVALGWALRRDRRR